MAPKGMKRGRSRSRNSKPVKKIKRSKNWTKKERNSRTDYVNKREEIIKSEKIIEKEDDEVPDVEITPPPLQLLLSTFKVNGKGSSDFNESEKDDYNSSEEKKSVGSTDYEHENAKRNDRLSPCSSDSEEMDEENFNNSDKEYDYSNTEDINIDVVSDPFNIHLNYDLSTSVLDALTSTPKNVKLIDVYWPTMHNLKVEVPKCEENGVVNNLENLIDNKEKEPVKQTEFPKLSEKLCFDKLFVKSQIQCNIKKANENQLGINDSEQLTPLQKEVFTIINNYQDLFYSERNFTNGEEIRFSYCLHVVNHVLKTRLKILHHNEKLSKKNDVLVPDEYRDQGLVRPKIVIIVPFKDSCLRIVNMISSILITEDKGNIINKTRFMEEFSGSELIIPKKNAKPEDYEQLFKGNIDDKFTIGISFTKKSLKLYSDFYSSDVIIASPLGLRLVVGAEGDRKRDFDFLASVEILILDQAEVFLMQNWDHILLILDHLHIQPKESHNTDFSRIRSWVLNGWSKFYRQTLIFSSMVTPELNSVFNRRCHNYAGKVRTVNPVESGSISMVVAQLSHVFQKFKADSVVSACESRFNFFTEKVLQQYKDPSFSGVLIYVPSYFDYVRVRNYLKREDFSFVQICEYSKDDRIARARDKFFHNDARFLLYSERFHFFRRIKLKGIQHIIFYQLPTFPHFYSELCNLMEVPGTTNKRSNDSICSVSVLYSKYDLHQLSAVVNTARASKLIHGDKQVHMFTTG